MKTADTLVDVEAAMSGLKDFQRDTVEYVFRRMWLDNDRTHRFLVADEVGLGKTMVARGVIAKTVSHLRQEGVPRIDVVYICSNAEIARQNIARLSVLGDERFHHSSRITLLPTLIRDIGSNPVNFISFTPNTSFEIRRSDGMASERVLLFRLLKRAWMLGESASAKNLFQGSVRDANRFREQIANAERFEAIDVSLAERFARSLDAYDVAARARGNPGLRTTFESLLDRYPRAGAAAPAAIRRERSRFVGLLRQQLAATCVHALEPDLVVMDEFQRFKHLLGTDEEQENPAAELASVLFNFETRADLGKTRVLLLSATPYRMYTMAGETVDDDHYRDFVDTLRFLQDAPDKSGKAESLLRSYKGALYRIAEDGGEELRRIKSELEFELRRVIVRTERLGSSADRNGMLKEFPSEGLQLQARDALAYRDAQRLARQVGHPDLVEYWKGAPYLLSFARGYALAEAITKQVGDQEGIGSSVVESLQRQSELHVPRSVRMGDTPVDPPHSRLRWLLDDVTRQGLWNLCWLPPSLPYYSPGGNFAKVGSNTTKRLIFSSWRMVPRAVAALLSLEAERRMFAASRRGPLPDAPEKFSPPLVFTLKGGEPTRMSTLALLYPSFTLASTGDPLDLARRKGSTLSVEEVLVSARNAIEDRLAAVTADATSDGREDDRWYWAAPVLLDLANDRVDAMSWLDRNHLSYYWAGEDPTVAPETEMLGTDKGWSAHVRLLRKVADGRLGPLGKPPHDLIEVLALLAVAGPANCALRSLTRGAPVSEMQRYTTRDAAASLAHELRTLFNVPEVVAMLRDGVDEEEAYWRRTLRYCADGVLQSVLDEWAHVLLEAEGLHTRPIHERIAALSRVMRSALVLRSAQVNTLRHTASNGTIEVSDERYRSRFALRFGDQDSVDESGKALRTSQVRAAFNSPFWPFVLASTTVGQEGLDFHPYCHAVVHWNLPHNPVDLEQREGRVHRYKGHAVRKNVARTFGTRVLAEDSNDPWTRMFDLAASTRPEGSSDIVPYWVFASEGGARIERHVPSLPMSRDQERLTSLRASLVLYRMVFGQPRQDELVSYLTSVLPSADAEETVDQMRIDLSPPRRPHADSAVVA